MMTWNVPAYLAAVDLAGVHGAGEAESIRQQIYIQETS